MTREQTEVGLSHDGSPEQPATLLAEAIEMMRFGFLLVAEDGFITFANAMARELINRGDGLRANGGWIAATSTELTARLRALVKASAGPSHCRTEDGGSIIVDRGATCSPLLVHVTPLDRRCTTRQTAVAAIFIIDPTVHAISRFKAFAALHGLSCAETRVLREIVGGGGLVAAANRLLISEATARTHLQHIFDKTGAKRQTELLCQFFKATGPAAIGGE